MVTVRPLSKFTMLPVIREFVSGDGVWEGTLKNIVPGEGYIYYSNAKTDKTFHYPKLGSQVSRIQKRNNAPDRAPALHFSPVDPYDFPDNMNMIAVVVNDGQRLVDAEVAAFINGECRGAIRANEGSDYYFLTVLGSSNEDRNSKVEIRVFADGNEYVVECDKYFVSDAIYGTLDEPYVLDLNATGIRQVDSYDDPNDPEWYTLEGFKIGRKPTRSGVYIHRGQKVTIRAKWNKVQ